MAHQTDNLPSCKAVIIDLLQEKNQVLYRYLQRESRIRSQILEQLEAAPKAEAVTARILEVKEEAQLIAAALEEYEG